MTTYLGRGSWNTRGIDNGLNTYGYIKGHPLTGSTGSKPSGTKDQRAVHYAVIAIQHELNEQADTDPKYGGNLLEDGRFGAKTEARVSQFQAHNGLKVDGRVGSKTAQRLFRVLISGTAAGHNVPPEIIHGQIVQESSYDPGAVNPSNGIDSGLVQINLDATGIGYDDAFDPAWAIEYSCLRFRAALDNFASKGETLQLDCAIAQHNSPRAARLWYASGQAPSTTIAAYVANIKKNSESF